MAETAEKTAVSEMAAESSDKHTTSENGADAN